MKSKEAGYFCRLERWERLFICACNCGAGFIVTGETIRGRCGYSDFGMMSGGVMANA